MNLDEAVDFLKSRGFDVKPRRQGPKQRFDVSWPDERRGSHLPEWRVIQIAEAWLEGARTVRSSARHPAYRRY